MSGQESQESYLCGHIRYGSKKGNFKGNVNKGWEGKLLLFVPVKYLAPKNKTAQAYTVNLMVHILTYLSVVVSSVVPVPKTGFVSSIVVTGVTYL